MERWGDKIIHKSKIEDTERAVAARFNLLWDRLEHSGEGKTPLQPPALFWILDPIFGRPLAPGQVKTVAGDAVPQSRPEEH